MHDFLLVRHCNYSSILHHLRVTWCWIIPWPWNLAWRSLKVIETGAIQKLGCGFLFAFYSNYGRICSRLWDIERQRMMWQLKTGLGFVQGHWKWHHLIDRIGVLIRLPWRYIVSFARYSDLLVENREIFTPRLYLAPPEGVTPSEFREDLWCW